MKLTDRNKKVIDILNRSLVEWYRTKSTTKPKPTTSGSNNEGMSIKRERFENAHHTTVSSLYTKMKTIQKSIETNLTKLFENGFSI